MRCYPLAALLLGLSWAAAAQNFGNIPPGTVLGNPSTTATQPARPIPLTALPTPPSQIDVYVSKAGADTNDCRASAAPCLTVNYALAQGIRFDVGGGNLVVNFQGVGDWAEDVFINGPLRGAVNTVPIPNIGSVWPSMVLLLGNGTTTLSGAGANCATLAASQYAVIGIKNMIVTGFKTGCASPLFAQMGGMIHIFGGNTIGRAGAEQLHCENPGSSIQIWENYTLTGGGVSALAASDHGEILISAGVGTIIGSPSYTTSFLFARNQGSIQVNIPAPWGATPVASSSKFQVLSNSVLELGNVTMAQIPGNLPGFVTSGGRVRAITDVTMGTTAGLGSGTAVVDYGTPYTGRVSMTPQGTPANNGVVNLNTPYFISTLSAGASHFGTCTAGVAGSLTGTTGFWAAGSFVEASFTSQSNIALVWSNFTAPLTAGSTYDIVYHCSGD